MISYPITMDGVTYTHIRIMKLTRSFTVLDGENAGRVIAGAMQRDIIGTFYNYNAEVLADPTARAEYDSFYYAISAPVDSHTLVVPFAQATLTFQAYVSQGQDDLLAMEESANRWGNLSFSFIAMAPQRTPA